jgi:hypothetical protein
MYHDNVTNLIHFHFHFIVSYPLHVSGIKRPSSGGTTLAVFGELRALVAVGWLQVVGQLVQKMDT